MVGDVEYQIGDCVMVRPDIKGSASYIGRIVYLLEEKHEKIAHVQYFCRGSDTVLGELSDKKELFALDDCEDVQLFELMRKVQFSHEPLGPNVLMLFPSSTVQKGYLDLMIRPPLGRGCLYNNETKIFH